ncbi:MAG: hypothetical protein E6R03_02835 [Hyphomicrobiaceae bacterium]|nr:MAG: hypothetical protein E6R03_02835 [Hyphomicrobiaceae bacterium]
MSNKYANRNANKNNDSTVRREPNSPMPEPSDVSRLGRVEEVHRNDSFKTFGKFVILAIVIAGVFLWLASAQAEDAATTPTPEETVILDAIDETVPPDEPTEDEEDTASFFDKVGAWFEDKEEAAKEVDERAAGLDAREAELNDYATALAEREELLSIQNAEIGDTAEELKAKANNLKQCVIDAVSGL